MPLDTSIALQTRPVQIDNPLDVQAKVQSLRDLAAQGQMRDMQLQQAQQAQQQDRTLADIYRTGGVGADGQPNHNAIVQQMASQGLGKMIPGYLKQVADANKAQADVGHVGAQTDELKFKVAKQRLDASGAALNSLVSRPSLTHDDVIQTITQLVQQGIVPQDQGIQMVRALPGQPDQLRSFLMQKGLEVMDASKRMDLLTPKFDKIDNGGAIQMGTVDQLTGQFTPGQAIRKVQTPDSVASNATTMRGQNMTDARAREGNDIARQAARTQLVETPDGYTLVDKGTGLARPAATMNGAQVQGKDSGLNDSQSKALLFGARMKEADRILGDMSAQGVNMPSLTKQAVEGVPLVGGALGAGANTLVASPQQQQVEQAQRDFVNAVLRRESGAAISPTEFDSARKQYFPQPGDSGAVAQQKAQNRQLAIRGLLAEVPAKKRTSIDTNQSVAPTSSQGGAPALDFQIPDDISALIRKHGGK